MKRIVRLPWENLYKRIPFVQSFQRFAGANQRGLLAKNTRADAESQKLIRDFQQQQRIDPFPDRMKSGGIVQLDRINPFAIGILEGRDFHRFALGFCLKLLTIHADDELLILSELLIDRRPSFDGDVFHRKRDLANGRVGTGRMIHVCAQVAIATGAKKIGGENPAQCFRDDVLQTQRLFFRTDDATFVFPYKVHEINSARRSSDLLFDIQNLGATTGQARAMPLAAVLYCQMARRQVLPRSCGGLSRAGSCLTDQYCGFA